MSEPVIVVNPDDRVARAKELIQDAENVLRHYALGSREYASLAAEMATAYLMLALLEPALGPLDYERIEEPISEEAEAHPLIAIGSVSDGFHTFDELYEHRWALFAALCRAHPGLAWRSRRHQEGGDPMFPGHFIAGLRWQTMQVSYHVREECWDWFDTVDVLEHAPTWDGHTPADVITRLNGWQTPGQLWAAYPQRHVVGEQDITGGALDVLLARWPAELGPKPIWPPTPKVG